MNEFFAWKPEYETGDTRIDKQHQHLLHLANLVRQALGSDGEQEAVVEAFAELIAYTEYHFRDEEAHWQRIGSPALWAQEKAHVRLAEDLRKLIYPENLNEGAVAENLAKWIEEELIHHMREYDQQALKAASEK